MSSHVVSVFLAKLYDGLIELESSKGLRLKSENGRSDSCYFKRALFCDVYVIQQGNSGRIKMASRVSHATAQQQNKKTDKTFFIAWVHEQQFKIKLCLSYRPAD